LNDSSLSHRASTRSSICGNDSSFFTSRNMIEPQGQTPHIKFSGVNLVKGECSGKTTSCFDIAEPN
ncbi:hypothetical protein, partial [uncultured Fibrobacter sp.]|uniref:hypothetical protein n=1 Tax=uncultured Fibrobacter sp. TaxID=261512 RepID=UPI0025F3827D